MKKIDLTMKGKDRSDYRKLPILTKKHLKRFRELGSQCNSKDPIAVVRFFTSFGKYDWYATSYNEETGRFWGLYIDHNGEGMVAWDVEFLKQTKLSMGLRIERDKSFKETKLSKISRI